MTPQASIARNKISIKKTFAAAREKLFSAWTDPEILKKWFGPSDEWVVRVEALPVRAGGRFTIVLAEKSGTEHELTGFFDQVAAPEKLVFSWAWEGDEYFGENRVTVELREAGASTELALTHGLFPDKKLVASHEEAWNRRLERLAKAL
ncbi:MAG: SRPBCC domain-containing protein [Elusimicrobiota bacterium]